MFAFRLCLALGQPHPDYLLRQLTSRQLAEWMAYFNLKPFGEERTHFLLAQVAQEIANRNLGKYETVHEIGDFLPGYRPPEMSPEEIKMQLRGILDGCSG